MSEPKTDASADEWRTYFNIQSVGKTLDDFDRNLKAQNVTIRTMGETKAEALEIARGVLNVAKLEEL